MSFQYQSPRCTPCLLGNLVAHLVCIACYSALPCHADERPNIVLILADDLAWSDLACYGHDWHYTPHLDRLAAQGLRFTNGYAPAPICSASRASILTGKTTARLGFEFVTKNAAGRQQQRAGQTLKTPPFTLNLPLKEMTMAECLREAGYDTAFLGKWHLNAHHGGYLGWSPTHGPRQQGFETAIEDFGSHPYSYSGKRDAVPRITQAGQYPIDSLVANAVQLLASKRDKPYLLVVSHFHVHTPIQTPCDWLLRKYADEIPADSANRERRIAYAAFVETLDHYVGQIMAAVDASGQTGNTLVVFTSDNGGHPEFAANSPLRGSKWNLYEGGIRVPFIARWPQHTKAGTTCSIPVIGYDLFPTFAEVAGLPSTTLAPDLDGISLVPALQDQAEPSPRSLYWHFPYYHPERSFETSLTTIGMDDFAVSQTRPQSAVRRGRWKLWYSHEDDRSELYDLKSDPGERHDMSSMQADVADHLRRELNAYLNQVSARRPEPTG